MKTYRVYLASRTVQAKPTEPFILDGHAEIDSANRSLDAMRVIFQDEAILVVDALVSHLPGGTLDQVLIELLRRKASLWTVGVTA